MRSNEEDPTRGTPQAAEKTVPVALLPSPEIAEAMVTRLATSLPGWLAREVDDTVTWKVDVRTDSLVGVGGSAAALTEVEARKADQDWDLVVAVTDLPIRTERRVLVAEINPSSTAGLVSLPALGVLRLRSRLQEAITSLVRDLHTPADAISAAPRLTSASISTRRINEPTARMSERGITVRYALSWKLGHVKLLGA